jgi:pyruvate/2-oxoglutarate dehydrogenase complex dihydrolipoamide acyltransferase (E2) component
MRLARLAIDVPLPDPPGSEGEDAEVVSWLVKVGDDVSKGQALVEVIYAKVTVEVLAPAAGRVVETCVRVGDVVHPQQVVARIE